MNTFYILIYPKELHNNLYFQLLIIININTYFLNIINYSIIYFIYITIPALVYISCIILTIWYT